MMFAEAFGVLASVQGAGDMSAITTGVSNLMTMASTMLSTITGNPILATIFATSFVGIAVGIVKKLKH